MVYSKATCNNVSLGAVVEEHAIQSSRLDERVTFWWDVWFEGRKKSLIGQSERAVLSQAHEQS
jgi:hypothetical protein